MRNLGQVLNKLIQVVPLQTHAPLRASLERLLEEMDSRLLVLPEEMPHYWRRAAEIVIHGADWDTGRGQVLDWRDRAEAIWWEPFCQADEAVQQQAPTDFVSQPTFERMVQTGFIQPDGMLTEKGLQAYGDAQLQAMGLYATPPPGDRRLVGIRFSRVEGTEKIRVCLDNGDVEVSLDVPQAEFWNILAACALVASGQEESALVTV